MGLMLKADSDRQELVRERRQARIERKQQRRDARERKRARISGAPPALSPMQRAGNDFKQEVHFGLMKNGMPSKRNNA